MSRIDTLILESQDAMDAHIKEIRRLSEKIAVLRVETVQRELRDKIDDKLETLKTYNAIAGRDSRCEIGVRLLENLKKSI